MRTQERVNECVRGINALAGFDTPECEPGAFSPLACAAHSRLWQLHADKPPAAIQAEEALGELLGHPYFSYDHEESTTVRPYARDLVSWPDAGNRPRQLADRLTPADQRLLLGHERGVLLTREEFTDRVKTEGSPSLYGDEVLSKDRDSYISFISDGIKRGIFKLGRRCKESARTFFVAKKDGRLRLVIDCRRANQRFRAPPKVGLFSAAGFGGLEVRAGPAINFAAVDVRNAFY